MKILWSFLSIIYKWKVIKTWWYTRKYTLKVLLVMKLWEI